MTNVNSDLGAVDDPTSGEVEPHAPQATLPGRKRPFPTAVYIGLGILVVVLSITMFMDIEKVMVGIVGIALMLVLMALGVPIAYAMIAASIPGLLAITGFQAATAITTSVTYDSVASWSLNVIPLFILMGIAMWRGGITSKAYLAARHWLGWLPGGLAISTTAAGAALATSSGSTMGITFALGKMSLPEMFKAGYKPSLATGSVAMAGTLGQIIPPSVLLVLYAGIAEVSVGSQLLAGIVPGLILAVGFVLVIVIWVMLRPTAAPKLDTFGISWSTRFKSLIGLIPVVLVAVAVIGGMFFGVFTATEAAAAGAAIALIVSWLSFGRGKRGLKATWVFLRDVIGETITSFAGLFIILVGALLLARFLTMSGVARAMTLWLVSLELDRVQLLLILIVVYIFLGMFLESLPMILLTVPLLSAPLQAVGVDMIWFGIFIVIMCEIGMVFPPIGLLTFVVNNIAQQPQVNLGTKVTLSDVFRGIMPFVAVAILITIAMIVWPDIVLFLPDSATLSD